MDNIFFLKTFSQNNIKSSKLFLIRLSILNYVFNKGKLLFFFLNLNNFQNYIKLYCYKISNKNYI